MSGQDCATVIDQGSVTLRCPVAAFPTWPEEFRRRYRELGYWTDETFAEFVADRVVVALPNVADFVAVVLGLFRLGALPIFALPTHRELELTQFCVTADAAAMVVATDDLAGLHAVVAECVHDQGVEPPLLIDVRGWGDSLRRGPGASRGGPAGRAEDVASRGGPAGRAVEDVAFLQLSGGTTGTAKLIPRTAAPRTCPRSAPSRWAGPSSPTPSPPRSAPCSAPGCSRCSAWPRASSTTPAPTTRTRSC